MPDPLDELRRAWRELPAPAAFGNEPPDPATRAAVAWMRRAWALQRVPAAPAVSPAPPASIGRGPATRFPWLPLAVAAAASLLVLVALAASIAPGRAVADRGSVVASAESAAAEPARPVQCVTATSERLELRSGAVTLVLLNPPDSP